METSTLHRALGGGGWGHLLAVLLFLQCSACAADDVGPAAFVDQFDTAPDEPHWRKADYSHRGGWLQTRWSPDNVRWRAPGELALSLGPEVDGASGKRFISGELKRDSDVHFGRYEVVMRAARGKGLNSTFFMYTGPHRGDPHDEIDFEFLGRTPMQVWLNYYVDGVAQISEPVDLGFDATAAAHHYAFEWTPDKIRWFADERLIFETAKGDAPPPQTPGEIYINLWAGSPDWLGEAEADATAEAVYHCVAYSPDLASPLRCPHGFGK